MQDVDGALLLAHAVEQTIERGHAAPARELLVGLIVVRERHVGRRLHHGWPAAQGAPVHEHDVHGDPIDPGAEPCFAPEAAEAPVHLDENLLHEILELRATARHPVHEAGDAGPVFAKKLAKSRRLAGFAPRDQVTPVTHHA